MGSQEKKIARALILSLLLAVMMALVVGCGLQQAFAAPDASEQAQSSDEAPASEQSSVEAPGSEQSSDEAQASEQGSGEAPTTEQYEKVLDPDSLTTTFIGEKFTDQKISNEDEAIAAVESIYDRIGADDTTELELTAVTESETGTTYYNFNQVAGDVYVYGAGVKVIADKDDNASGVVSAILPEVELAKAEDWEITAAQAEEVVVKECEEEGIAGVKPVADSTEQLVIPIPNMGEHYQYAWVVYTPNFDTDSEMAYLAHYVDGGGDYMYAIPISEPHNADAKAGDKANFDFDKYEQGTWKGVLTLHDGTTKEAEVPVLVDKSDGTTILGDGERKILCADFADWRYEETLSPRISSDNTFDNVELLAYDTFIKVWDFYENVGWPGPDGVSTPTLLLMDYVNSNGEAEDQAMYSGRQNGFQVFAFNRLNPDGENMDVIAHEFTHCVTSTAMTSNIYRNEMGAINEGMSDVMGNLIEMLLVNKPETAWLIGDSSGVGTLRSMKDPHEFNQPEFRWDTYYAPDVTIGTGINDNGGVHVNSSMLNIVSYKLDQAGMAPNDQFYFWMNVAMTQTPQTDYAQMAQLLLWCMEQAGYPQYLDALREAIDAAGYSNLEEPSNPPEDDGKVAIEYNVEGLTDKGLVLFMLDTSDGKSTDIMSWPAADTNRAVFIVPADEYFCKAYVGDSDINDCAKYIYTDAGWQVDDGDDDSDAIRVKAGETLELSIAGLPETVDAVGE